MPLYYDDVIAAGYPIYLATIGTGKNSLDFREAVEDDDGHLILMGGYYLLLPFQYLLPGKGHRPQGWLSEALIRSTHATNNERVHGRPRPTVVNRANQDTSATPPAGNLSADDTQGNDNQNSTQGNQNPEDSYDNHVRGLAPDRLGRAPNESVHFGTDSSTISPDKASPPDALAARPRNTQVSFEIEPAKGSAPSSKGGRVLPQPFRSLGRYTSYALGSLIRSITPTHRRRNASPTAPPMQPLEDSLSHEDDRILEQELRAEQQRRGQSRNNQQRGSQTDQQRRGKSQGERHHDRPQDNQRRGQSKGNPQRTNPPLRQRPPAAEPSFDGSVPPNAPPDLQDFMDELRLSQYAVNQRVEEYLRSNKVQDPAELIKYVQRYLQSVKHAPLPDAAQTPSNSHNSATVDNSRASHGSTNAVDSRTTEDHSTSTGNPHVGGTFWRNRGNSGSTVPDPLHVPSGRSRAPNNARTRFAPSPVPFSSPLGAHDGGIPPDPHTPHRGTPSHPVLIT